MKKFLLFLLLPFISLAQDMKLDHSYIDPAGFVVGDIITVKFNTVDWNNANSTPSLVQYDFQYNNKLLELVDYTWKVKTNGTNSTAQTAWNEWTGYKFTTYSSYDVRELTHQYDAWAAGIVSYAADADWNVVRVTIQDGQAIKHSLSLIEVRFEIKNINATNYTDYSETTKLNWARAIDNSTGTVYDVDGMSMSVDLGNVSVPTNGGITLKVNVPHTNKTNMKYNIYHNTQLTNGIPTQGEVPQFSGAFDANGEVVLNNLYQDEEYYIDVIADKGTNQWLDDVITVTDVYKVFKYAKGDNLDGTTNGWEYYIQKLAAEVTNDNKVDFDDSYELLAHINGYASSANVTSDANDSFNFSGLIGTFGNENDFTDKTFTPTANTTVFTFGHGLKGDVDFSHSTQPTSANAKNNTFTAKSVAGASKVVEQANLDIVSSIVGDKVELAISTDKIGLVGTQITINFDDTILEFDSVVYDTGNTMTNFSRVNGNKLWIGSLDSNGTTEVKTGTPYKVIFKTKQTIQNTIGLINYRITEGVKANGTKVNFNIQ
jgi:hypothetical protein